MKQGSYGSSWLQRVFGFHCSDCGSDNVLRSRPRTFGERYLLPVFLLRPVRCAECFRREYRTIFMPVSARMPETLQRIGTAEQRSKSNVA
jgi:hypothetical protein